MKVKITHCQGFGELFNNIKDGSIHEVIPCPKIFKRTDHRNKGVWVMGVGEPVKVLSGEYVTLKK
jgi:hypothetical protein